MLSLTKIVDIDNRHWLIDAKSYNYLPNGEFLTFHRIYSNNINNNIKSCVSYSYHHSASVKKGVLIDT